MKKRTKTGKKIKRTIIFILFLAALGAVFYFGFYQFQLPADTYGVIFTKYTGSGWDPDVVVPGTFRFEWEGLFPLNLSIEKFNLLPVTSRISVDGKLPSSDVYSMYLEGTPDFSYSYTFDILYTVKPDSLAALVSDDFLRDENFSSWLSDLDLKLSSDAVNLLREKSEDDSYMNKISYNYRLMESDLIKQMSRTYSYIDFVSFIPVDIRFPDLSLYTEGRRQYFEVEKAHSDIQKATIEKSESRVVEESAKLDLLEKYGALFAKYPQLIEYYSIFSKDGVNLIPVLELPDIIDDNSSSTDVKNE